MKIIRIGTRESKLAVVQANIVADAIHRQNPEIETRLVTMKTTGDRILDRTLDKVGGKGLFVKELDAALLRGEVDICVHSYKDMPAEENPELPVVAVSPREDARDVLLLPQGTEGLDPQRPIGCSSQRRHLQIGQIYAGQPVAPVRGNVLTRLEKLDRGEYAALVLAAAGIRRLGLWERVSRVFSPQEFLPCGCQGILAVQGRRGEDYSCLAVFHDPDAWDTSRAERAFVRRLECGCGAPVGVYAELAGEQVHLRGMIAAGGQLHYAQLSGDRSEAEALGAELADSLRERAGVQWRK